MKTPSIVVVLTHTIAEFTVKNILKIGTDIGFDRLYVCYDNSDSSLDMAAFPGFRLIDMRKGETVEQGPAVCVTDLETNQRLNKYHKKNRDNYDTPIAILYDAIKCSYDYMWFIEYDVVCYGDWNIQMTLCDNDSTDFMAAMVLEPHQGEWGCWTCIDGFDVPHEQKVRAFVPVSRYSNALVKGLRDNLGIKSGWVEIYHGTLCKMMGLTYKSFPNEFFGDLYTCHGRDEAYWNEFTSTHMPDNKFYHPIKPGKLDIYHYPKRLF